MNPREQLQSNFDMHQEVKNISIKSLSYGAFFVATGLGVISVSFVPDLRGIDTPTWMIAALMCSWVFDVLSIAALGFLFWSNFNASLRNQVLMNIESIKPEAMWNLNFTNDPLLNKYTRITNWAFIWTATLLVAAVTALFVFAVGYVLYITNPETSGTPEFIPVLDGTSGIRRTIIIEN